MRQLRWFKSGGVAAATIVLAAMTAGAQDTAPSVLNDPALSDLDEDCMAIITLLERTPGTDIANLPQSEVDALEPGSRDCVLKVQELLGTSQAEMGSEEASAAGEEEIRTPEAQSEALTGEETAEPETGEAAEQSPEETPEN